MFHVTVAPHKRNRNIITNAKHFRARILDTKQTAEPNSNLIVTQDNLDDQSFALRPRRIFGDDPASFRPRAQ